ncbi:MAG: T9SS type A sorting domain-containing protein [Crocinitomicaceae bacterium]
MKQHFSIPSPCSEKWDAMAPTKNGAFCTSCSHEVHDLTQFSSSEIREKLDQLNGSNLCVRIHVHQITKFNDEVEQWYQPDVTFKPRLFLFALFLVFGMTAFNGSAQIHEFADSVRIELVETAFNHANESVTNRIYPQTMIKGQVTMGPPVRYWENGPSRTVKPKTVKEPEGLDTLNLDIPIISNSAERSTKQADEITSYRVIAYPNPTTDKTILRIDAPYAARFAIRVFSESGNTVQSYGTKEFPGGSNEFTIDLSNLARGVYIVGLQSPEFGKTLSIKKL